MKPKRVNSNLVYSRQISFIYTRRLESADTPRECRPIRARGERDGATLAWPKVYKYSRRAVEPRSHATIIP